ncbi:TonB-dependent receptor [Thalassotalea sp. M1531]|uniref:TonB-dependent receptor n=1 Tax=Thalassotalea algicola TaxID=2716224 RepID=A0A7Y0LDL4_9GAMM|nr:TonB-dependent receptor [Thalassotalea algicola]NMP32604.1 TonB-dependent receptor [Thalassotalea algicola]
MKNNLSKITLAILSATTLNLAFVAQAQEAEAAVDDENIEIIEVKGIRASLATALAEKQSASNLVEVINAIDIGKLPDQNLAEVLENVTGVQITRTAGIGTGVQIRGSNANRVEINGVSTVGAGSGRNGISFEDVNASIIAGVEVTKAPDAKTIEGSVGGTVNLRTIRPLQLSETLASIRVQGEDSSLSTEDIKPRFSGAFGDNWDTEYGKVGFVMSGSYTEQEAVSFRPRADRDNIADAGHQGIQFLVQEQENDDYETLNLATTFEWAPTENMKFHADIIINDQERSRDQYRLQASGVSALKNYDTSIPSQTEQVDYGFGLPIYNAALVGVLHPDIINGDDDDPNLRFTTETGSRVTDTSVFVLGGEWQGDKLFVSAEFSSSQSDSSSPTLNTTVNFINPNCPLDASSNDNCVPYKYDLSGGSLAFGIDFDGPYAPTPDQLLDPNNVVLDQVDYGRDTNENSEEAVRVDFSYFLDDVPVITSVDWGLRYSESSHEFRDVSGKIGGFSRMSDSASGADFADLLVKGPSNYGDGDDRSLFIRNFLLVDPDKSFTDALGVWETLKAATIAKNPDASIREIAENDQGYRKVEEETTAIYAQANFEYGDFIRGNIGVRYIETDITSTGFQDGIKGSTGGSYDFLLPRLNLVIDAADDVLVRVGYGTDIRRPDFDQLGVGYSLDTSENAAVSLGNPGLEPEEVDSFDLSVEWYFAPSAIASVGYFKKERTNIFGTDFEGAQLYASDTTTGGLARDQVGPVCEDGGFWNPIAEANQLGDPSITGMCVDQTMPGNDPDTTEVDGFEFAFQYSLADFEDELGWASGFGVIANYTMQDFSGGSVEDCTSGRGETVLGELCIDRGLLDFSENAYNFTLYYEKYGLSARMRYTWREAFRTQDYAGGANSSGSSTLSFPVVTDDRGQLNASISYDINDKFNIGIEAVNLTEESIDQYCVAEDALLCFVGLPDRRITFGASYRF